MPTLTPLSEISAWEASLSVPRLLALFVVAAGAGTVLGAAVELLTNRISGKYSEARTRLQCARSALVQLSINGALLLVALRASRVLTPWMQITMSGFLFSVLLFVGQGSLGDNARCMLTK